jgi:branched-chain amino acid aminotransferase
MHRLLLHNDEIRNAADAIVSPGQIGLMNGWGVFSTLRIYDGVMFEWDRHFARMKRDAAKVAVPFSIDSAWLHERLTRLIDANHAYDATLRVCIVRNQGGEWLKLWTSAAAAEREFDLIAFTGDVKNWGDAGVKLGIIENARYAANEFAGTKVLSWSHNLTWFERAHRQGLDEVVLLNERGEVSECTSANIFAVHGTNVFTPPLTSACLAGITRAVLLEEVRAAGLTISEKTLMPADLEAADEIFITSTTRELLPVATVEGLKLRATDHSVRARLQQAFTAHVRAYTAARLPKAIAR